MKSSSGLFKLSKIRKTCLVSPTSISSVSHKETEIPCFTKQLCTPKYNIFLKQNHSPTHNTNTEDKKIERREKEREVPKKEVGVVVHLWVSWNCLETLHFFFVVLCCVTIHSPCLFICLTERFSLQRN